MTTLPSDGILDLIERFGVGSRGSNAVTHNGTGYFAVVPQAPYDASLSAAEQTRQLLDKADARLIEIGSAREKLLFVAIILPDMADYVSINEVWDLWVKDIEPPARACFQAGLASPAMKIEMIMICAISDRN